MTYPEFDQMITHHHPALVKFASYLGANRIVRGVAVDGARDLVHDTVVRLLRARAYEQYTSEPDASRIPAWLRRAVEFTVLAEREKVRRRHRLVGEDIDDRRHVGELGVAQDAEGADLELVVFEPSALQQMVHDEEADQKYELLAVMAVEMGKVEPATATGMRLVLGDGASWDEAAKVTGVGAEALRKRVNRAIPGLREKIIAAVSGSPVSRTL